MRCSRTASLRMLSRSRPSEADKALGVPSPRAPPGAVADLVVVAGPLASPMRSSIGPRAPGSARRAHRRRARRRLRRAQGGGNRLERSRSDSQNSRRWLSFPLDQWLTGRETSTAAARASFWTICGCSLRADQVEAEPQRNDGAQGDRYGDQAAIMGQIGAVERRMFADAIHHGLHQIPFRVPAGVLPPEDRVPGGTDL